jgi:hypothetical protein
MKRMTAFLLSAAAPFLWSCQSNDLGSGANTVDREFAKPAHDVWKASVRTAESLDLRVASDSHDRFGGEMIACRANGDEVRVHVRSLDDQHAQVSVRVEPGDRALATLFQERIAEKLGLGEASSGFLGGHSVEGSYPSDLGSAVQCARRTLRSLLVTVTQDETHADWARIDGRLKDSTPVRIRVERVEESQMKVSFIAGNEKTEDNKAFARRMKEEFEALIRIKGTSD